MISEYPPCIVKNADVNGGVEEPTVIGIEDYTWNGAQVGDVLYIAGNNGYRGRLAKTETGWVQAWEQVDTLKEAPTVTLSIEHSNEGEQWATLWSRDD